MPVTESDISIFDSKADILVNPVNCVGVMGAGLALEFKKRFPLNYENYRINCQKKLIRIGHGFHYYESGVTIFNLPTKEHYWSKSTIEFVESGLISLLEFVEEFSTRRDPRAKFPIKSVCIPALGCGLGGLDYEDVRSTVFGILRGSECEFTLVRHKATGR